MFVSRDMSARKPVVAKKMAVYPVETFWEDADELTQFCALDKLQRSVTEGYEWIKIPILCLFGSARSAIPANCPGGTLTNSQRDMLVTFHNQYRSLMAKGNAPTKTGTLLAGGDLFELEYDCTLEAQVIAAPEHACGQASAATTQINSKMYTSKVLLRLGLETLLEDAVDAFYEPALVTGIADATNKITVPAEQSLANIASSKNKKFGCSFRNCSNPYTHVIVTCKYDTVVNTNDVIYTPGAACTTDAECAALIQAQAPATAYCNVPLSLCTTTQPATTTPVAPTTSALITTSAPTIATTTAVQSTCPNAEMTDMARRRIRVMHNNRRLWVAQGNVKNGRNSYNCPKAANMFQMVYDCGLETDALTYAKGCSLTGSATTARPGQGENVFVGPLIANQTAVVEAAVQSWFSQITRSGINKKMTFLNSLATKPNAPLAFTQMVWALSTRIGCGIANCLSNTFTVCRYAPAGNILNQQIYQLGQPCSTCSSPCVVNGLCQAL